MPNCIFFATAYTKSALIRYKFEICSITPRDCFPLENTEKFRRLCAKGCTNYKRKWSCPPYSPLFYNYASRWNNLYVLYMRIDTDQFSYIKNDYLKIKAANSILKSRADKYLCTMATKYGRYISTGSCRLCKPCKCKVDMPCAHPDKMTYSFEALGIDVDALVNMCFQEPLLWYKPQSLPEYTSVVCGLLTNDSLSIKFLADEFFRLIKDKT
jgi:predicted metal-binding protein